MHVRRIASLADSFVLLSALLGTVHPTATASPSGGRPNIVLIITDDQSHTLFNRDLMPSTFGELVDKGALFNRFYVATPVCCPSRSEMLTGLYEHHTGVDGNEIVLKRPTIVEALHDSGYRTMLSGKYMNSWPCKPRPEFDEWVCSDGHSDYVDPTLNVNGQRVSFTGYTTQIEAQFASDFIESTPQSQPFFVLYAPKSPHLPANDPRYDSLVVDPVRGPAYDQETRAATMPMYMHRGPLTQAEKDKIDLDHMNMAQTVRAVDDDIASLLASLGSRAQNTLVVLASDNGFLDGEHRQDIKWLPYEEAQRVPFIVRYPPLVPENQAFQTDALVQNVDIAPTISELAGLPWAADGKSLVPLLDGSATSIRDGALVEHCEAVLYPCYSAIAVPSSRQIVTSQYTYTEFVTNEAELYDLTADSAQLTNLAFDPGHAGIRATLSAQLAALTAPVPTDTTIVTGPSGVQHARGFSFTYFSQSRFATYECRLAKDGVPEPWEVCDLQPFVVGALDDGDYEFQARGTDENGVTDPTPASRFFSLHATGPLVQITSAPPLEGHNRNVSFQFSGEPSVVRFECKMAPFGSSGTWSPCTSGVAFNGLGDGLWSFKVRGFDAAEVATDPPAQWLFEVDHQGPVFVLTERPEDPTSSTTATFSFYPSEATTGVFRCKLDSQPLTDCSSGTVTYSGLTQAKHTVQIKGIDLLGDIGTTKVTWIVDTTPPAFTIDSGPPPLWDQNYALFSFTAASGKANFTCALDQQQATVCLRLSSYYELADGPHTLTVTAFDGAGNVSAPQVWNWTQQTAPLAGHRGI